MTAVDFAALVILALIACGALARGVGEWLDDTAAQRLGPEKGER